MAQPLLGAAAELGGDQPDVAGGHSLGIFEATHDTDGEHNASPVFGPTPGCVIGWDLLSTFSVAS